MLSKEEIIVRFLDDPREVDLALKYRKVEASDEIRELICNFGQAQLAFRYAVSIDRKVPHDLTREISSKRPDLAFYYAKNIDKKPHAVTWNGVYRNFRYAREYMDWEKCVNRLKKK